MAKLILKFEAAVLKEIPLQKATLTIGRAPGNDVVIDNLAVSNLRISLAIPGYLQREILPVSSRG